MEPGRATLPCQPATSVTLRASDGNGHTGTSNPFESVLQNDLSITMVDSPDPVSLGANVSYVLTVANTGPASATGVIVSNVLPANCAFVSATSSQGTCSQSGGIVTCNLGSIPGGANATVTIVGLPTTLGVMTNSATVSRAEADPYLVNNVAVATTAVILLDHFEWSAIPSTQYLGAPFAVSVTARNFSNGVVTNFSGPVSLNGLSGTNLISISPAGVSHFNSGVWSGKVSVLEGAASMILRAREVVTSRIGDSNPIHGTPPTRRPLWCPQIRFRPTALRGRDQYPTLLGATSQPECDSAPPG